LLHFVLVAKLLLLLSIANGGPVIAKKICGGRFNRPIDGGRLFLDGRPVFGASKTVRGALVSLVATAATAPLLGLEATVGAVVAASAMIGDLSSSFVKRRLNLRPGSRATGLDQIPEALLPLLACLGWLPLTRPDILVGVAAFFLGEIYLSRMLYHLRIRDRPY